MMMEMTMIVIIMIVLFLFVIGAFIIMVIIGAIYRTPLLIQSIMNKIMENNPFVLCALLFFDP